MQLKINKFNPEFLKLATKTKIIKYNYNNKNSKVKLECYPCIVVNPSVFTCKLIFCDTIIAIHFLILRTSVIFSIEGSIVLFSLI